MITSVILFDTFDVLGFLYVYYWNRYLYFYCLVNISFYVYVEQILFCRISLSTFVVNNIFGITQLACAGGKNLQSFTKLPTKFALSTRKLRRVTLQCIVNCATYSVSRGAPCEDAIVPLDGPTNRVRLHYSAPVSIAPMLSV